MIEHLCVCICSTVCICTAVVAHSDDGWLFCGQDQHCGLINDLISANIPDGIPVCIPTFLKL